MRRCLRLGGSAGGGGVEGLAAGSAGGGVAGLAGVAESLGRRRGLGLWLLVALADQFDVEDQLGLGGNAAPRAVRAVGELVRDEEATLAADAHAVEAGVPAGNDVVLAVGEGDGVSPMVDGGVEFGAVGEIAGVVDGVPLVRCSEFAGADLCVDVVEGDDGGLKAKGLAQAGAFEWRDILELYRGFGDEGVERLGAGGAGGKRGNLWGEFRQLGADWSGGRSGRVRGGCGCAVGGGGCGFWCAWSVWFGRWRLW